MAETLLALGDYRFSMNTADLQKVKRAAEYRWQAQNRFGRAPAMQYVGEGKQSLNLNGILYPHFRGGLGQIDKMRQTAQKGKPLLLVTGTGKSLGKWIITRVEETQSVFLSNGNPRKIEFNLALQAYGDDNATVSNANR